MDHPTPQAVLSLFRSLTTDQQTEFIQLVAREATTDLFNAFYTALPQTTCAPFLRGLLERVVSTVRPILIRETALVMKQFPTLSVEELVAPVSAAYERSITELEEGLTLREQHKFGPLVRKGQTPKAPRNEIIKQCLEEQQFTKAELYQFMVQNHGELMTIANGRLISEKSMWDGYSRWLRKRNQS